jgi:tetratricopeptide (TPR) repeat protein
VAEARRRYRAHDAAGALALLEPERPFTAAEPERTWLLAHLLVIHARGAEARARARALPRGPYRDALVASLAEDAARSLEALRPRLHAPPHPWVRLAAARLHAAYGNGTAARGEAAKALRFPTAFVAVEAHLVLARDALDEGDLEVVSRAAQAAARLEATDTRPLALLAEAARRAGDFEAAVDLLVSALAVVPESEFYARMLADLVREDADAGDGLSRRVAAGLRDVPPLGNAERLALAGLIAQRGGRAVEARDAYGAALAAGADPIPVAHDLRRLWASEGRYAEVVEGLFASVPPSLPFAPTNLRRPHWTALRRAGTEAPDASASPAARRALAEALVGVGALAEATSVLQGLTSDPALDLADRIARHVRFRAAVEAEIEDGYRRVGAGGDPVEIERVLARMRDLACEFLSDAEAAAFAHPTRGLRRAPVLGALLDYGADTASPVVAHFRRYGEFLILGQRSGQPTEAILLSLASLERGREIRTRCGCYRHDQIVGYDVKMRSFRESQGGGLGGACLPDGLWLDVDSARRSEHHVRRRLLRDPERVRLAREAPSLLGSGGPEGVFDLGEPAGVGLRLIQRYVERCAGDGWGSFATLRAHESAHVVELRRHLPIFQGLPETLALVTQGNFCDAHIEAELERRAQLAAVAESPYPDLALAEMIDALPTLARIPEVHDAGYRNGIADMVRFVYAHPNRFPQIDRRFRILPQLDRLTNEQLRAAARAVLPR